MITKETQYTKDVTNKKILVTREFDAPLEKVWEAWPDKNILDQWWAPRPWKARTKSMDFREGGIWLYCMEGPEGEKQWCRVDYQTIVPNKSFTGLDAFCDEQGNKNNDFPGMQWKVEFSKTDTGTNVIV